MRIALIHANDGSDVRIGKTCRSLVRLGFDTHYIGWDRRPEIAKLIDLGGATAHVMRRATVHGRSSLSGQAVFIAHSLSNLRRLHPDVVCAVNEEHVIPLLPFKGILYRHLVCDIFDSLTARTSERSLPVRLALGVIGEISLRGSDRLIVTDEERCKLLDGYREKAVVVENLPEDPGEVLARTLPEGPVQIWAAGTLHQQRGLRQLLEAIETLDDVRILSAGWPYDAYASDVFLKHPRVEFLGVVTAREALEAAARCDAVFSYYAPHTINMIYASPNKVYDALAIGRPVLINREVRLSSWVVSQGLGQACPYEDVACLRGLIAELAARRRELVPFAEHARALFIERYHWGLMESRLEGLYTSLGQAST